MLVSTLGGLTGEERYRVLNRARGDISLVQNTVEEIIFDVKQNGDTALIRLTEKFDGVVMDSLRVQDSEIREAVKRVPEKLMEALKTAHKNIEDFHRRQLKEDWSYDTESSRLGQIIRPICSVGCYVPGGRASYPSTVLMTATPARVAGVNRIVCVTPPNKQGKINDLILAACLVSGVDEVYKVGGAQAIGALAHGTESIKKVEKIVGPGNIFVTSAKRIVSHEVAIDNPAGPSEVLIIADDTGNPEFIMWDMIAQSEHDPKASSVLITTSKYVAREVEGKIKGVKIQRQEAVDSLQKNGVILLADNMEEAVEFSNEYAPEHLQIISRDQEDILKKIQNAGSIFLGNFTPVACGDYASGTNHVLPTSGYAKVYSGLNINDFIKYISVQKLDREGLEVLGKTIIPLAEEEGLFAHAQSVRKRIE